ncbi:hypothetical protein [Streptomyces griseoloalbus]|uniref:Uncharacterized protein n=1 Tax=Streptomyces griseoloalbus TaxID=67303 RepID=A0A7W8BV68_9ACTN|nr:hypothetical protein [Streptomyces albaduncus]MBB5130254.1 hypothetical protein [Streptomyces albaduncus]GGW49997.1 hypothetical protein GCM10010340_30290 [Streptomyces albaduncus]
MATPTHPADVIEDALAHVWTDTHREFGPDETTWTPGQVREYLLRLDAARIDPGSVITI